MTPKPKRVRQVSPKPRREAINVRLSAQMIDRIKRLEEAFGVNRTDCIRHLLMEGLKNSESLLYLREQTGILRDLADSASIQLQDERGGGLFPPRGSTRKSGGISNTTTSGNLISPSSKKA